MKITVLEYYREDKEVKIELNGKSEIRVMDLNELSSIIEDVKLGNKKDIKIEFEEPITIQFVTVEEFEEGYDIILNSNEYTTINDMEYKDELIRTVKRLKTAEKVAKETQWKNRDSTISEIRYI